MTPHQPQPQPQRDPAAPSASRLAAAEVRDRIDQARDSQVAYEALEVLVTPGGANDRLALDVDRTQLGALLRALNRVMREDVGKAYELAAQAAARRRTDFAPL